MFPIGIGIRGISMSLTNMEAAYVDEACNMLLPENAPGRMRAWSSVILVVNEAGSKDSLKWV